MAKIMVVDDSKIMRKILTGTLTDAGHEVIKDAANGKDALDALETMEIKPDLITLDITMPVMDGIEALKNIREKYPDVKVVMVSAAGQKSKVLEALKAGALDFLQKPFEKEDVVAVIGKFVNNA
ncbi:MAG: response regulator [Lachnospiraceae bacterium]|nr:response regulator [Lachnospiraceae bacterium]